MPENKTYFERRMEKLGITPELNQIKLVAKRDFDNKPTEFITEPIFRPHEKGIEILVYNLDRSKMWYKPEYTAEEERKGQRKWSKAWSIIRYEYPEIDKKTGKENKYKMPKGAGSFPFFPPSLVDKVEKKTPIKFLYLTEGFFKAFKGSMHGLDIVGLPSITHLKQKDDGALHQDIKEIIRICKVENVVWLTDGDCFDLSKDAKTDKELNVTKRPHSFYSSIDTFKTLLSNDDCDKWFMHINTRSLVKEENLLKDDCKGLDDLLCALPDKVDDIVKDLQDITRNTYYTSKYKINITLSRIYAEYRFNDVTNFYLHYVDIGQLEQDQEFIFFGTKYKYNHSINKCEIIVPGEAKDYFRVGTQYFKFVKIPNKYGQLEEQFHLWDKGTIKDDHKADFLKHIPKYQAFCNVPDHTNYQRTPFNCFNVYSPLDYEPSEESATGEDCPTILGFIQHIFGQSLTSFIHPTTKKKEEYSMYELGLDYIQLLYQNPTKKLPILCLVSKENNTGKSTLGKLLKLILGSNCAIVGNQDLAGDFNKHWATKCLVICDEAKIDKQIVIEKVKSLSTADKITMNSKGRDQVELDCFIKFIFITNNEENFIYASEDDIRYWVIKVPTLKKENPSILDDMLAEIPAFLSLLNQRKLVTEELNRMWFHPQLLKTEALKRVIEYSKPTIVKELKQMLKEMFQDFGVSEIYMSRSDVHERLLRQKYEVGYVEKTLKDDLKVEVYHEFEVEKKQVKTLGEAFGLAKEIYNAETELDMLRYIKKVYKIKRYSYPFWEYDSGKKERKRVEISANGRPYIFKRSDFVKPEDEVEVDTETAYTNGAIGTGISNIPGTPDEELPFPLN